MVETIKARKVKTVRTPPKARRDAHTTYSDRRWRRASEAFIRQYPICVLCVCRGETNQGATDYHIHTQRNLIVDHITPHRGDGQLFWDCDNWQTLCRMPCHDRDKQRHDTTSGHDDVWFAMLRKIIQETRTGKHVEYMAHLLPQHIKDRLTGPAPGGGVEP